MRHLNIILGDQLDLQSPLLEGMERSKDLVWMAEVSEEATHVWTSKMRIAVFLSAMRHFRKELEKRDLPVHYTELMQQSTTLGKALKQVIKQEKPEKVRVVQPGEWRVLEQLRETCQAADVPLEVLEDAHFLCSLDDFEAHADGRKSLRMEYFYREMRKRHDILMTNKGKPEGGKWNYDADNRDSFGKDGPDLLLDARSPDPDTITSEVIELVNERFAKHPGQLAASDFRWPVTRRQALAALTIFIEERLPNFGQYQDAMWTGEPFLYHSLLANSLNLKLLNPREVIAAAEAAYRDGDVPLAAAEGFIRQILGWREYVRGIYWRYMPDYVDRNHLDAELPLPDFYWDADTEMRCLREALSQTLRYGYAHHIQRLMVTGLFALLLGVRPKAVHEWYLSVYVDAVEWVELPNTLGMSQFGDGGIMASKPYVATGKYLDRMSNYCQHCPYNPAKATGEDACPFTTLYWDFLTRNRKTLEDIPRMGMQLRNVERKDDKELKAITEQANALKQKFKNN